jgi:hypothetical protein
MHVISLYLVLHTCAATFDVMCVKKTEATKRGLIAYAQNYNCGVRYLQFTLLLIAII